MDNFQQKENRSFANVIRRIFYSAGFRIGLAFILGVFAGFLIFSVARVSITGTKMARETVTGTMWDSRSFDQMTRADNLLFQNPMAKATFDVRYSTRIVEMHIAISSLTPVQTIIDFDPANFRAFAVQNINVNEQGKTISGANYVQIDNFGDNEYVVILYIQNNLTHQIGFRILQNENTIYQNSVTINKE